MPTSILISKFYHYLLFAAQSLERLADRFRVVERPHQFADVLLLSSQCTVCLDVARFHNSLEKVFIKWHRQQVGLPKRDELLTEFLQRQVRAFSRAFTGLCIVHRLQYLPRFAAIPGAGVYHAPDRQTDSHKDS